MESFHKPCKVAGCPPGREQQISRYPRELKIQRRQLRVVAVLKILDALVRRQVQRLVRVQGQPDAVEQLLVRGDVVRQRRVDAIGHVGVPPFFIRSGDLAFGDGRGITADIVIIFIARRGGNEQRH